MNDGRQTPALDAATLAERVRTACLRAALDAYESAGMSGLCEEGRWEAAVDAIRALDLRALDSIGEQRGA
ncbi:MAG: acetyltransferase [Gemmatimonadota bacterium]|nr:acetyltransferase [Gemmatimonadota bacterium]